MGLLNDRLNKTEMLKSVFSCFLESDLEVTLDGLPGNFRHDLKMALNDPQK